LQLSEDAYLSIEKLGGYRIFRPVRNMRYNRLMFIDFNFNVTTEQQGVIR